MIRNNSKLDCLLLSNSEDVELAMEEGKLMLDC
jgi:hypothetical protein